MQEKALKNELDFFKTIVIKLEINLQMAPSNGQVSAPACMGPQTSNAKTNPSKLSQVSLYICTRAQFHQCSKYSFNVRGAQMSKMILMT